MEGSETWDEDRWEEYKHDRWMLEQELGEIYYKLYASEMEEENEDVKEVTRVWREEEEIARKEYFRKLEKEEQRTSARKKLWWRPSTTHGRRDRTAAGYQVQGLDLHGRTGGILPVRRQEAGPAQGDLYDAFWQVFLPQDHHG